MEQHKKNKEGISNPTNDQNPSTHSKGKFNGLLMVVLLAVFIISGTYAFWAKSGTLPFAVLSPAEQSNSKLEADKGEKQTASNPESSSTGHSSTVNEPAADSTASTGTGTRLLTYDEGQSLKTLIQCTEAVDEVSETVSAYASASEGRNNEEYRKTLMAAVAVCIEEEQQIEDTDVPAQFETYKELCLSAVSCKKNAFNCWYDGSLTNDPTRVEQGNTYINQANYFDHQQLDELEAYLKTNGYKYSRSGDEIQFWYQSK